MEINRDTSYLKCTRCPDVYTESVTDYILPDYLGDVRKILHIDSSVRPAGRFASGDEVEFTGVVVYKVVYLDGEGQLGSAEFTSDYNYSVRCSADNYHDSVADTRVSGCNLRLLGPRKINARTTLVGSVRLVERCGISVSGSAFDCEYTPEINTGRVNISSCRLSSVCEREYAESMVHLDGAIGDELNVVYSSGECCVDEMVAEDGSLRLKGKILLCGVIKNGDEPAYGVEKAIPYDEKVEFSDIGEAMSFSPVMTITSLKLSVNNDESGCDVVASVIVEMYVVGEENEVVELIYDGYLKEYLTDNSYADFSYRSFVEGMSVKASHSCDHLRGEIDADGLREILFLSAEVKPERVERENGRLILHGEVKYSGVASAMVDESVSYLGIKFSSPFSINVNHNCQIDDKMHIETNLFCLRATASIDAERIYASCNIEGKVSVYSNNDKRLLVSMSKCEGEECRSEGAKITVYYPSADDTLFSVAKRFRTSGFKLASDNDISATVFARDNETGSLDGVKKLIIY